MGGRSLRHQFGGLLAGAASGIAAALILGAVGLRSLLGDVEAENERDRRARAESLLRMEAQAARDRVEEYAFWDDTWDFATTPTAPGADEFVRENFTDWFPSRYGDDLIRIWNRDGRLLVQWTGPDAGSGWVPDEREVRALVRTGKGMGGYYAGPAGPMLFGAAAIQHTDYQTRNDAPNGVILIARLLDSAEAALLGSHLQEGLRFEPAEARATERRLVAGGDSVETRFTLAGSFGQPAAVITLTEDRLFLQSLVRRSRAVGVVTVLLGGVPLLLLAVLGWRSVIRPLDRIAGELGTMQAAGGLTPLVTAPTAAEWRLFVDTFNRTVAALRESEGQAREAATRAAHEQKLEAIGALAGGVAHDFNNLLGAILVAVTSLQNERPDPESQDSIETIGQAARRAAELTQQLLQFARRGSPVGKPVSPAAVVANVERLCRRTFDPRVRIRLEVDQSVPTVRGDAGQLEHALLNLCINARDAMPEGGTLRIGTRRVTPAEAALHGLDTRDHVALSVTDTGTGIAPEVLPRLFEPFFTTKGVGRGTGLGLAIVYGTAKAHGGDVAVESVVGRGTRFHVFLPADGTPVAASVPTTPLGPTASGRGTVLVIDDETGLRSAVVRALTRLGYRVYQGVDGQDGLRTFQAHADEIDVLLLDLAMPELPGADVFQRVREVRPSLPVIVTSGHDGHGELEGLLSRGAAFLPKPFELAELSRAVAAALGDRGGGVLGPPTLVG